MGQIRPGKMEQSLIPFMFKKLKNGKLQSVNYYDSKGERFSMEHYNQKAPHKVTLDGQKYNLKNTPHEHQTRILEGPNGPFKKKQVRILNEHGKL